MKSGAEREGAMLMNFQASAGHVSMGLRLLFNYRFNVMETIRFNCNVLFLFHFFIHPDLIPNNRRLTHKEKRRLLVCIEFWRLIFLWNEVRWRQKESFPCVNTEHSTIISEKKTREERKGKAVESLLKFFVAYMIPGELEWMTIMVRLENSR